MKRFIEQNKTMIYVLLLILSILTGWFLTSHPEVFSFFNRYLEEKQTQVMTLSGLSAATATTISLLPGDAGAPIANTLMDMSGYLLVVMVGILMEKVLMAGSLYLAFYVLFPLACLIGLWHAFGHGISSIWQRTLSKLITIGLVVLLIIPASIGLSVWIERYLDNPIEQTIDHGEKINAAADETLEALDQDKNLWKQFVDGTAHWMGQISSGITGAIDQAKNMINRLIDSIAMLLITSIVIPILVYVLLYLLLKQILGTQTMTAMENQIKKTGYRLKHHHKRKQAEASQE